MRARAPPPLESARIAAMQIAGLVADALQRRARDFLARRAARQADDGAARVAVPMRRAEAGEGGHQIDAAARGRPRRRARRPRAAVAMMPEPVAQPLHGRAGREDRAFERVGALAVPLIGDGRQQSVLRARRRSRRC